MLRSKKFRPTVDSLETRNLMAVVTIPIVSLSDHPAGSIPGLTTLRDAITEANSEPAGTVSLLKFEIAGSVNLQAALPILDGSITIHGLGNSNTVVDGGGLGFSTFSVQSGSIVRFVDMTIQDGSTLGSGGNLTNFGQTTIVGCDINLGTAAEGGGIYNAGKMVLRNTVLNGNIASVQGGGIYNSPSSKVNSRDSEYELNSAPLGGAVYNDGVFLGARNQFPGNIATTDGSGFYNSSDGIAHLSNSSFTNETGFDTVYNNGKLTLVNLGVTGSVGDGIYNGSSGNMDIATVKGGKNSITNTIGTGILNYGSPIGICTDD